MGILQPGELGVLGERIEWITTVTNIGSETGINVVITDTVRDELRIDSVTTEKGSFTISGQTVIVTIPSLAASEVVRFSIFTTVLESGIAVDNTACVSTNGGELRCATTLPLTTVSELPGTGETPWWRGPLMALIVAGATLTLLGAGVFVRRRVLGLHGIVE